ncbi:MAG: prepilin-type N-terminal cleavage/methylation domain-containing protein [Kofleriaceae bacterium]
MRSLATRLARSSRHAQRGMTLLEIMIVLAILALVMGLVVGPRVMSMFKEGKKDVAQAAVMKFAHEAYTQWSMANPQKGCPEKIEDLSKYMNSSDVKDPWGTPYKMFCGANLPAGVQGGFGVMSVGEDGKEGTEDDVKSWEH